MRGSLAAVVLVALISCKQEEPPPQTAAEPTPGSLEWKVRMARGAAPWEVAVGARVVEMGDSGMTEIAPGTSGWTCIVDVPVTPVPDPMCADSMFLEFVGAQMAGRTPQIRSMAVGYMLHGGQVASDTDPMKMRPDSGQDWLVDPPHLMIAMPNPRTAFAGLPTTRTSGGPWVMWTGTPYAHLMVPAAARR